VAKIYPWIILRLFRSVIDAIQMKTVESQKNIPDSEQLGNLNKTFNVTIISLLQHENNVLLYGHVFD
jgi:uncharacterized membrane protein